MESIADFVCDNFKYRSMGLVCDFAEEVDKGYAAVFPSSIVMEKILTDGVQNAMLFVHHPAIWDIRNLPQAFVQMDRILLEKFKQNKISIFNFHVPLDHFGEYSTSVSLARALNIQIIKPFALYRGSLCGIIGKTDMSLISDFKNNFENIMGHKCGMFQYGSKEIENGKLAVTAGGGNDVSVLREMIGEGVNVLVTGIIAKNEIFQAAHDFAREHKINLLGGTHYSTEKFACMGMVDYFQNFGLPAEFVPDKPIMEDIILRI